VVGRVVVHFCRRGESIARRLCGRHTIWVRYYTQVVDIHFINEEDNAEFRLTNYINS